MFIYHGSYTEVKKPEIRKARKTKDFGYGFYCTIILDQAKKWALKFPTPYVNTYNYRSINNLKILEFKEMTNKWLEFIVDCRAGKDHDYDIVIGPMADDQIYSYINDYINGNISKEAFWALARFRYPTNQILFHTNKSLEMLLFVKSIKL